MVLGCIGLHTGLPPDRLLSRLIQMPPHTVLRPATDADIPFLFRVYASSRADEMALVDWSDEQKQDFLQMQFDAQHSYYHENYAQARFDVIEVDGVPVGRL